MRWRTTKDSTVMATATMADRDQGSMLKHSLVDDDAAAEGEIIVLFARGEIISRTMDAPSAVFDSYTM
jgi:hypothetical protein